MRNLGLLQVYPDPHKIFESKEKDVDIIAIHGLDTHSPKTWVAWLKDGDPKSGEVHWLQDSDMLPSVVQNARIFTYDWNANFDMDTEAQTLTGHANVLLNKLHNLRRKEQKHRPIVFVSSCFGGLLLAKALVEASYAYSKYLEILMATSGIVFLGTPFRGSHKSFYTAAELRRVVAQSMDVETSTELLKYLQPSEDNHLEELFQSFCRRINQLPFKIRIVCFYETHPTDFTKIIKHLPPGYKNQLGDKASGILVPRYSASLPGSESLGLSVRHAMLNKYATPEDESFVAVSSTLEYFAMEAKAELEEKLAFLNNHLISLLVSNWPRNAPARLNWRRRFILQYLVQESRGWENRRIFGRDLFPQGSFRRG